MIVPLNVTRSVPNSSRAVAVIEPAAADSPDAWSGYGGVVISGSQLGSPTVFGLVSCRRRLIAVTGRQNIHSALSRHVAIAVSALFSQMSA